MLATLAMQNFLLYLLCVWRYVKSESRVAICVTGQLARLELGSKIHRLVVPNLHLGSEVGLFIRLDYEEKVHLAHPTFYGKSIRYGLFAGTNESELYRLVNQSVHRSLELHAINTKNKSDGNFVLRTSIQSPLMKEYVPTQGLPENCTAKDRFQIHMRWRESLRECMLMVEKEEILKRKFYDVIIRIREDSFVLKALPILQWLHRGKVTSDKLFNFDGVNDHTLIVPREYAEKIFRGSIEDYYLNTTVPIACKLSEQQLKAIIDAYNIPTRTVSFCLLPIITLRGISEQFKWRFHQVQAQVYWREYKSCLRHCCEKMFKSGVADLEWPDIFMRNANGK